jgi:periplasmic protein TonB
MFEDSLMESDNRLRRKNKGWSFVAFLLNAAALVALVIWPLLHPEALPRQMMATLMVAPSPPPTPPPAPPAARIQAKGQILISEFEAPSRILKQIEKVNESAAPPSMLSDIGVQGANNGMPGSISDIIGSVGNGPAKVVKQEPPTKVRVSSRLMIGNLLDKTIPQYPAIAREARIQGIVVLQATISKSGSIENLRVIGGPPMLQQAAMDAVRSWRYKPYLLNGEPVEVETTINVVFNLGE